MQVKQLVFLNISSYDFENINIQIAFLHFHVVFEHTKNKFHFWVVLLDFGDATTHYIFSFQVIFYVGSANCKQHFKYFQACDFEKHAYRMQGMFVQCYFNRATILFLYIYLLYMCPLVLDSMQAIEAQLQVLDNIVHPWKLT